MGIIGVEVDFYVKRSFDRNRGDEGKDETLIFPYFKVVIIYVRRMICDEKIRVSGNESNFGYYLITTQG